LKTLTTREYSNKQDYPLSSRYLGCHVQHRTEHVLLHRNYLISRNMENYIITDIYRKNRYCQYVEKIVIIRVGNNVSTRQKVTAPVLKLDTAEHHCLDRSFQTTDRKNANDHSMES
jgi:hypothetical protein